MLGAQASRLQFRRINGMQARFGQARSLRCQAANNSFHHPASWLFGLLYADEADQAEALV